MRRELYRVWIISHCCSEVSHKPTSRCFVLITMQVEAFLSAQRANRVFRSCFVHMFQTTTLGTFVVVLVVRGRADGSRQGLCGPRWRRGRRRAHRRERHGPAQAATCGNGAGQRHNAPGHAGIQAKLLALHHIEGAVERNDNLALVVEGITGRAFAMCLAIRRGVRLPLPQYVHSHRSRRYRARNHRKCKALPCRDKYRETWQLQSSRRVTRPPQTPRAY